MHRPVILAIALALGCTHARVASDPVPDFARRTDETRASLRIPGLSIAVARDGQVLLARGFGVTDLATGTPTSAETIYPVGSITKTFTSTLMLQLAEAGRLDLERDVAGYVDWEVPPDVRIRHVLSHTSEGTPGTRFSYSSRFNWLDNVVEAATKENFRALLTSQVLSPAGLTNTHPGEEREGYADSIRGLASPHRVTQDGHVVRSQYLPMALHSSSGLSSTVSDLVRYSIALDDGRLLSAAARERAWAPAISTSGDAFPYGAGWFTQTVAGERVVWHTSWWPDAYSGLLVKVPSRKLTLAVLANTDGLVSPQQGASNVLLYPIANDFLRTFLGGVPKGTTIQCCEADLESIGPDDRVRLFGESGNATVRKVAIEAGRRLVAAWPEDLGIAFDLAMIYGRVRPSLRINGAEADQAFAVFKRIAESTLSKPKWMEAWSNYLVAEHLADRDPAQSRTFAERASATGVDTDGLTSRIAELLERTR